LERVVLKQVIKTKEPRSLTHYRASISKQDLESLEKYENAPKNVLDDLRQHLLEEQGYICCYCMSRIDYPYIKIEHFQPRSVYREKQLDYSNLFVSCCGKKINKSLFYDCKTPKKKYLEKDLYCDTKKGKQELNHIKLLINIQSSLEYKKDGFIYSTNTNIDKELDEVLNLNYETLKTNREDALKQFICELKKTAWTIPNLKLMLEKYKNKNSKGKYRPYCEMIVYFINKKLKQKGATK
jgi:uncharacterized protein (TIGR02646 family)